ncbi:glycosyltransferase family 32 protein [Myroides sp. LJL115]
MIPKIIHICWFGKGQYTPLVKECLASFTANLPDYQLMVWNEDNFDIDAYPFAKQAYGERKFAFVSDVCRLHALQEYGGVYMDTDVEVLKSLDGFLKHDFFIGFESDKLVCTALIGAVKNHPLTQELLDFYKGKSFYRKFHPYKKYYTTPNTITTTKTLLQKGLKLENKIQHLSGGITVYPTYYFSPINVYTQECKVEADTYAIHRFSGSWKDGNNRKEWIKKLFKK